MPALDARNSNLNEREWINQTEWKKGRGERIVGSPAQRYPTDIIIGTKSGV